MAPTSTSYTTTTTLHRAAPMDGRKMATEDERYRTSSQYRLWSFSRAQLHQLRDKTNILARQQNAARLGGGETGASLEFLTAEEELSLVRFFTIELIRAAQFCELPTEIRSTAAIFFRRFYVTNSVMTYPPTELLKTSLFFGCKAEGFYIRLGRLTEKLSGTTPEQILAGEFLLCQGIRFAFDVRHPFRGLEGAVLELRRRLPAEQETRINRAHARSREILKFSPLLTDVYFHYTPSQIMLAALQMADAGLADMLIPAEGVQSDIREKIMATVQGCRVMLEQEPPERMAEYWETVETAKSMKPLRKKLQKCRDPDRVDLVALQKARREQAMNKEVKKPTSKSDNPFGGDLKSIKADDPFGGAL
ncbi:cyclin H [Geosmithia morbida]|uniref:Cyclin H n=1 Tax=Geosmithia morbida TaxID=1094350 RepID=A0A9P4YVU1_9HYPO|nr:cyclin H [Geosmithia morbida]KAF4121949.1 cyclin H [Geosmithia morbida]